MTSSAQPSIMASNTRRMKPSVISAGDRRRLSKLSPADRLIDENESIIFQGGGYSPIDLGRVFDPDNANGGKMAKRTFALADTQRRSLDLAFAFIAVAALLAGCANQLQSDR
jgi:hypothetical protein